MKLAKLAMIAAIGAGTVGAAVAVPGTAFAGSNLCGPNLVCIYDNANFGAMLGSLGPGYARRDISAGNNDKLSSWENKTGTNAAWYEHGGGGGQCHNMLAYRESSYVGFWDNDEASSWQTNGSC